MRILVLVDGSKCSQRAALQAFSIAKRKGAEVVLYSVLDRMEAKKISLQLGVWKGDVEELQKLEESAWENMKKSIDKIMTVLKGIAEEEGVKCSTKVVEGKVREKLLEEANGGNYDLIVMGAFCIDRSEGTSRLFKEVVGSIEPPLMVVH